MNSGFSVDKWLWFQPVDALWRTFFFLTNRVNVVQFLKKKKKKKKTQQQQQNNRNEQWFLFR